MRRISYKRGLIGIGGVFALCALSVIYYLRYPIDANNHNLRESTVNFLHGEWDLESVKIYDAVSFDDKKYVLAQFDGNLGRIDLIKGICGRYRIESIGSGSHKFRYRVEESNKRKYIVFGGENQNLLISKIKFNLGTFEYSIDVPNTEYFLTCLEVDSSIQSYYPDSNSIKFYTADGQDITDEIEI